MPKFTVEEEFAIAIKAAASAAKRSESSRQLAEAFYDSEPEFIAQFQRVWAVEAVRSLIARERGKLRPKSVRQQLGFGSIGKVVLRSGEPYRDATATLWTLQQLRKQLGATDHPALAEVLKRIDFLTPYAHAERGITFPEACKRAIADK